MSNRLWQWMTMRWRLIVVGALLAVLLLIHITSLRHKELTTDEPLHYQYGYRVLHGTPRRTGAIDSSTMPFSAVHAMTSGTLAVIAGAAGVSVDMSRNSQVKRGRYATIALSLLLALYVLKWSYELYGRDSGRHVAERSGKAGPLRYRCSFAIAGVVCVEMELRTLRP